MVGRFDGGVEDELDGSCSKSGLWRLQEVQQLIFDDGSWRTIKIGDLFLETSFIQNFFSEEETL